MDGMMSKLEEYGQAAGHANHRGVPDGAGIIEVRDLVKIYGGGRGPGRQCL